MSRNKLSLHQLAGINRQNHTTNILEDGPLLQTGWKYASPGASSTVNIAVTFPVAFTNIPIVVASFGGDTVGATTTLGSGGANVKNADAEVVAVTTSGCTIRVYSGDNTSWSAGNTVYAHWIAIGV